MVARRAEAASQGLEVAAHDVVGQRAEGLEGRRHPVAIEILARVRGEPAVLADRPHRQALERRLPEDVDRCVEIAGWPLTLQLVALGVGVAIVNDFCRPPRGVAMIAFDGLGTRRYWVLRDRRRELDRRGASLWARLAG